MLFGSEPFEHLIGELRLATIFKIGGDLMGGGEMVAGSEEYLTYKQKRREVLCAVTLSSLLRQFECGDEVEFEQEMHTQARNAARRTSRRASRARARAPRITRRRTHESRTR